MCTLTRKGQANAILCKLCKLVLLQADKEVSFLNCDAVSVREWKQMFGFVNRVVTW